MKKFHLDIIYFTLVLATVLITVEFLLGKHIKTHIELKFDEIYHPKVNADIIFLGNSHTAHSVNPKYLKLGNHKIYNFALNGSSPQYYKKWYNKVFRNNYPKPKYLIYGVDWGMFDESKSERRFNVDIRLMPISVLWDELLNDHDISRKLLITNYFNLLSYPKQLQYVYFKKETDDFLDLNAYYNGYIPHFTHKKDMSKSPETITSSKKWEKDFNDLIREFQQDSIQVIFINIPEYIPSWKTKDLDKHLNYLDSLAIAFNVPYLKYNQDLVSEINYDSTYFNNWIHLNDRGATKFSEMLSNDLQDLIK